MIFLNFLSKYSYCVQKAVMERYIKVTGINKGNTIEELKEK